MSIGWIVFWAIEALLLALVIVPKFFPRKSTSVDVLMGDEIGNALLILLGIVIALIAFLVYGWQHFRITP